jgi:hypothetical protein
VTGMHLLHIDGYSAAERMVQQGKFIESRTFSTGGHKVVAALLPQRLRQQIRGRTQRRHQISVLNLRLRHFSG